MANAGIDGNHHKGVVGIDSISGDAVGIEATDDSLHIFHNGDANSWQRRIVGGGQPDFGDNTTDNEVKVTSDGEMITTVSERERNLFVAYSLQNVNLTGYAILVDLDDTTNYPTIVTGKLL